MGFDVPLAGAVDQPWHRDFPAPEATTRHRRLTSLAVNVTAVDTEPDMGSFEIAPGAHWDDGSSFDHGMFPARESYPRYRELATRKSRGWGTSRSGRR
jgi:ectoine hydroxylase-related dioxygenase (phytanoyl-CoA dioxygenase family)